MQLSLEEPARSAYSSKASVSRWLGGHALPSEKQAIAWARTCDTDVQLMLRLLAAAAAESGRQDGPPVPYPPAGPVYFVKTTIPHLKAGQASSKNFELKEPVGTSAQFWVISVDNGGLQALNQNQVIDQGHLYLPSGTIRQSAVSWHKKGWQ